MVKYYYYFNLGDPEISLEGNDIKLNLNGMSFKSVKVLNSVISVDQDTFNPTLRLGTYTGNGFSADRMSPVICLFNKLYKVSDTDWRYTHDDTPNYNISESLAQLSFYITDGTYNNNIINPTTVSLQMVLELDDE